MKTMETETGFKNAESDFRPACQGVFTPCARVTPLLQRVLAGARQAIQGIFTHAVFLVLEFTPWFFRG
jgi:hypothetical protein